MLPQYRICYIGGMENAYPRTVLTEFRVLLDDVTVARLMEIADSAHAPPELIISGMVTAICEDDWHAHLAEPSDMRLH